MKKIRTQIKKIREGYLTAKTEEQCPAYSFANVIFIYSVFILIYTISAIIYNFFQIVGICMIAISIILFFVFLLWDRAFSTTLQISVRILDYFFARYGRVVSKTDWKQIKKNDNAVYKELWDKNNIGYCYYTSRLLALYIKDAKIMYCSIQANDGAQTAHAVVVKNNCIYDTNYRGHYDFDEYIKMRKAEVYKIFEKEVYLKNSFFDDVREDFKNWCAERNVYCDPQ